MRRILGLVALALLAPVVAHAQMAAAESRGYVSFYAGLQAGEGASSQGGTFTVYEERGSWSADQSYDGGGMFWFGGGVKVTGHFAVGAAYSRVSDTQDATVSVTAPHPLIFNSPRSASASQGGLKHSENAFHVQALYVVPVNEQFEVALGGGPSWFAVTHDFVTNVGFTEGPSPFTTISVGTVSTVESDKTVFGFNVGADATYYFSRNVGAGGFLRYAGAGSADMDVNGSTVAVDVGGFQFGGGVRLRF